jgi:hypothetical protein
MSTAVSVAPMTPSAPPAAAIRLKISATLCGRRSVGTQKDPPGTKGSQSGVVRRTMTPWMASLGPRSPEIAAHQKSTDGNRI